MTISKRGLDLLKSFEGLRLKSYQDPKGVWTIGYGTTFDESGAPIRPGMIIPLVAAEKLLLHDISRFERILNRHLLTDINQNQFDALLCLLYNIGESRFISSTLLSLVNQRRFIDAAMQFDRWNKITKKNSNGKPELVPVEGLTNRRKAEKELFLCSAL